MRTRITFSPPLARASASSAENTMRPDAAPGDAGRPLATTLRSAFGSRVGCSSWSSAWGSMRQHRLLAGDQALLRHVDGDLHGGLRGALAGARLQHPELAALDGELDVLHVAVVALELLVDPHQLAVGARHLLLEGRERALPLAAAGAIDGLRRADARHHVLALRVLQVLAVEHLVAGRGVAREGDARGAVVAHVAEHHRLHVHGRAPALRDARGSSGSGARGGCPRSGRPRPRRPTAAPPDLAGRACRCALPRSPGTRARCAASPSP